MLSVVHRISLRRWDSSKSVKDSQITLPSCTRIGTRRSDISEAGELHTSASLRLFSKCLADKPPTARLAFVPNASLAQPPLRIGRD
jgi:hypothetical protein